MIKTLEQAGLDNRGEVHAPLANEGGTNPGRIAEGLGGSVGQAQAPTQTHNHNPHSIGEGKEWLDRKSAKQEGIARRAQALGGRCAKPVVGVQADPQLIGDVMRWLDTIRGQTTRSSTIIAYIDKLSVAGQLPKVNALYRDPEYKRVWRFCVRVWGDASQEGRR